ncbi:uncharacterized protein V6R79_016485 [Siganus canaliculatus]
MAYKWPPALKNSPTLFATESDNDMLLRSCCSVWILLTSIAAAAVFVERRDANAVLQRWRRANSGFLEELKQGDLERECIEEKCDYEEAREVFEDDDKTKQFWQTYEGHDPCLVNPCHNNGTCVFSGSTYQCHCAEGFGGRYCKTKVEDLLKCLYENGQCQHFCDGSGEIRRCFCADGYKLGADGRECVAEEEFPCGRLVPQDTGAGVQTRLVGGNHCPKGNCPWQVLVQLRGQSHCGGALIKPDWVVTAAHCIHGNEPGDLTVVAELTFVLNLLPSTMLGFQHLAVGLLLLHLADAHSVFLDGPAASQVLIRQRRANSFLEELKQGDMERECMEERCNWEEAREIFENVDDTNDFWAKYYDGDACESTPCANGGLCKDGIGSYSCYCQPEYKGFNCEIAIPQLCENKNGGCEHFCNVVNGNVECSCATGYFLSSDYKSCSSNEPFKCGALITENIRTVFRYERKNTTELHVTNGTNVTSTDEWNLAYDNINETPLEDAVVEDRILSQMAGMTRIVNGEDCPPGECPWQALILDDQDLGFCGGTILNEWIILSAAHCMNHSQYIYIKLGEFDMLVNDSNEAVHQVETIITHNRYKPNTFLNDIALIKLATPIKFTRFILPACLPERGFAEEVLMKQPDGMVSGFGLLGEKREQSAILQRLTVPYVDRRTCLESTQLRISTRMFCAGYDKIAKDACRGDSGGPHVTSYRDTYFVTGVVSWGEGCARKGKYGIYTQVSKYIGWIQDGIERLMGSEKSGSRRKRRHGPIKRLVL